MIRGVFIFCRYSFINYEIYFTKFLNKKLTNEEIQLINQNSPIFNFTFDEIMSFNNKIDIYIVNKNYLVNRGINQIFLNNCNLSFFINNGKKYLYFFKELKLLMIEPFRIIKSANININNNNTIINLNCNKINILNYLILFHSNDKQIKKTNFEYSK